MSQSHTHGMCEGPSVPVTWLEQQGSAVTQAVYVPDWARVGPVERVRHGTRALSRVPHTIMAQMDNQKLLTSQS